MKTNEMPLSLFSGALTVLSITYKGVVNDLVVISNRSKDVVKCGRGISTVYLTEVKDSHPCKETQCVYLCV